MDSEFNFKKFENTNKRYEDRITITGTNSFGFPTKFYKDNNLEQYKYVELYFDEIKKAVGFRFTNSEEEKFKFTMIKSKEGYGGSIIANSFFKVNNINSKKYRGRYTWTKKEYPEIGFLFIIVLKENPNYLKNQQIIMKSEKI